MLTICRNEISRYGRAQIKDQASTLPKVITAKHCQPTIKAKALEILKNGGDIDYVGATAVELIGPGESAGSYREFQMKGGKIETVRFR